MRGWRILLGGMAAAVAVSACHKAPAPPPQGPPTVGFVVVETQPVTLTAELPGRTSAYQTSDVRPQVNGILRARLFTEGSEVRAGQVLYEIDPAPYRAALAQARAALQTAQATVGTLRLKAERYADLVKINAVARQEADDAKAAYDQAVATVAQQRAAVQTAQINVGYTRVTAPISGRIGRSLVTPGALVSSGQAEALATIQQMDPIYVDLTQSADQLLQLRRAIAGGQLTGGPPSSTPVKLLLQDGTPYPHGGVLRLSEVTVEPTTGSVTLRAAFPNPERLLLPQLYVRAVITQGTDPDGVLAPQAAVSRNERGQATAFVVGPDGKAQPRILKTGQAVGASWLVLDGLKPGDRLITEGLMKVKPGAPVKAVAAGAGPGAAPGPGPGQPPGAANPSQAPTPTSGATASGAPPSTGAVSGARGPAPTPGTPQR